MRLVNCIFLLLVFALSSCVFFSATEPKITHSKAYSVKPPSEWKKIAAGEGDEAFLLKEGSKAYLNSSCNQNTQLSLDLLVRHLLFGIKKIHWLNKEKIKIQNYEGLLAEVRGVVDNKELRIVLFVLPVEECIFDFSLVGKKDLSEKEKREFVNYLKSFHYADIKK